MAIDFGFEPSTKEKGFIFISYAHDDSERIAAYVKGLHDAGYEVWYDRGIYPFENFKSVIIRQIRACSCFIAFISQNYADSPYCLTETSEALAAGISRLPIFIEKMSKLPDQLIFDIRNTQFFNAYECSAEFTVATTAERIRKILSGEIKEWSEWSQAAAKSTAIGSDDRQLADAYALIEQGELYRAQLILDDIIKAHPSNSEARMGSIRILDTQRAKRSSFSCASTVDELNKIKKYWQQIVSADKPSYVSKYNKILESYAKGALDYADALTKSNDPIRAYNEGRAVTGVFNKLLEFEHLSEDSRRKIESTRSRIIGLVESRTSDYNAHQIKMQQAERSEQISNIVFWIVFILPGLVCSIAVSAANNGDLIPIPIIVNAVMAFAVSLAYKVKTGSLPDIVDEGYSFLGTIWGLIKIILLSVVYSLAILLVLGIVVLVISLF